MLQKSILPTDCQRLRVVGTNGQWAYAFLGGWPQSSEISLVVVA